jgi:hypothetical protein
MDAFSDVMGDRRGAGTAARAGVLPLVELAVRIEYWSDAYDVRLRRLGALGGHGTLAEVIAHRRDDARDVVFELKHGERFELELHSEAGELLASNRFSATLLGGPTIWQAPNATRMELLGAYRL